MTRFWRNGYERISPNGDYVVVQGHWVERDRWGRVGPQISEDVGRLLELPKGRSACFVTPNASCPVCGDAVFYYQNEFGSRVYFDELGPPWPKHPCTDNHLYAQHAENNTEIGQYEEPASRDEEDIRLQMRKTSTFCIDFDRLFEERYKFIPWKLMVARKVFHSNDNILVVADFIENTNKRNSKYFSYIRDKYIIREGELFAIKGRKISVFDRSSQREVRVLVRLFRRLKDFIDAIASS